MRDLIRTWFILLIVAQSSGCANLSSSPLNSATIQEQVLQENTKATEVEIAPIVRAQSSILTLPPAMRLSISGQQTVDTPEIRSSRSEARHQRALKFAQAQKDVVAKYQQQKQAQLRSDATTKSQVIQISATAENSLDSDSNPAIVDMTTNSIDDQPASLDHPSWYSFGRRMPIFITMLVIAIGSLTWPFTRVQRHTVNEWIYGHSQRTTSIALPVLCSEEESLAIPVDPVTSLPQKREEVLHEILSNDIHSFEPMSAMIAQMETMELPPDMSMACIASCESCVVDGLTLNVDALLFANENAIANEVPSLGEASISPESVTKNAIAIIPRRTLPSVQTIELKPQSKPVSRQVQLALPYYVKESPQVESSVKNCQSEMICVNVNAVSKLLDNTSKVVATRQHTSTAMVSVDQLSGLPARAAHHRSISLNHREIGSLRNVVGVVVLFPQDENGEPTRHVMMVESYELNEHSQLTATVVRVA